jgi:hypothetical protein
MRGMRGDAIYHSCVMVDHDLKKVDKKKDVDGTVKAPLKTSRGPSCRRAWSSSTDIVETVLRLLGARASPQ